ncbi:serum amyloid A-2 protein-like [Choloepus didactylus]|uniref:serum amyloid A-2 protein-like n=1 Tax=Choloepus didactylus TaxID=27675 RepID=UPI00189FE611|nr:serum amyloid A-2 protein-like [Choloepus didactylus]XP_037695222.1 serum amyloid A-2 protein-like [Choloepus didactylus]
MKLFTSLMFCSLVLGVSRQSWFSFPRKAAQGARDSRVAYPDTMETYYGNSDNYFHTRGNYDVLHRTPKDAWAAEVIRDYRENSQRVTDFFNFVDSGHGMDSRADQAANEWGRSGEDPNHFQPAGLPGKY